MLTVLACTPAPRPASDPVVHAPTKSVDMAEPVEAPPQVRALVEDLAVVLPDGSVVQDSAQCFVGASWAGSPNGLDAPDLAGAVRHVIDADGVAETTMPPTGQLEAATHVRLATRSVPPHVGARLQERWLEPRVPDDARIGAWVRGEIGKPLKVVGQIRGTFGDGVDRIVVLAPRTLPTTLDDEDAWRVSEVAVLVAGDTPKGLLPFTRTFDEPGIHGLQVAGVLDLDGDGIEEVLWSLHPVVEELMTEVHVSYFADGGYHVHELSSCTYSGCNVVLPEERCRGPVKRMH